MGRINSRAKGKRGELQARDLLRRFGFEARRSQQFAGSVGSADLTHDIPGVHVEVKYVERLNIQEAMEQARRDCGDLVPVVLHRRNGTDWLVTLPADEFLRLVGGEDLDEL